MWLTRSILKSPLILRCAQPKEFFFCNTLLGYFAIDQLVFRLDP